LHSGLIVAVGFGCFCYYPEESQYYCWSIMDSSLNHHPIPLLRRYSGWFWESKHYYFSAAAAKIQGRFLFSSHGQ
jgi:hypothetical protein